jgi:2-amino-4-hydroxy-6-hydroxymethyldihydropteridine diphosphokinase
MNIFQVLMASNTNARVNMETAIRRIDRLFDSRMQCSEMLESAGIDKSGNVLDSGATYLNALCLIESDRSLEQVQSSLKVIEAEMGRVKGSDVVIDLDLVVWNGEILRSWDVAQSYYQTCLDSLERTIKGSSGER